MKKIIFWLIVIFTILSLTSVAYAHQYPFHKDVTVKAMERKVKEHAPSSIDHDFYELLNLLSVTRLLLRQ